MSYLLFYSLNLVTNYVLFSIIFVIINKLWLSCFLFSVLTFVISAANYYTIELHESPLTVSALGNFKTAFNVIGGYDLKLYKILPLLAVFVLECILSFFLKKFERNRTKSLKKIVIRNLCLCLVSAFLVFICYFSPQPYMPELKYLRWTEVYQKYGYMPCTVAVAYAASLGVVQKPEGYRIGCVENLEIKRKDISDNETPDVILIMNESFYDLSLITELKTDVSYTENISYMD